MKQQLMRKLAVTELLWDLMIWCLCESVILRIGDLVNEWYGNWGILWLGDLVIG